MLVQIPQNETTHIGNKPSDIQRSIVFIVPEIHVNRGVREEVHFLPH